MLEGFGTAFGGRVRELREAAGATQDQLARAVTRAGFPWTRARLGQIETGEGTPDLAAMVAVAAALTELSGQQVRLVDLLPESGVAEELTLLRDALAGEPVRRPRPVIGNLPDPRLSPGWGQVEDRVAAELGVGSEGVVLAVARRLYDGRSGSEERDHRAGGDATPQKRGRVSRIVIAELAAAAAAELAAIADHDAALEADRHG